MIQTIKLISPNGNIRTAAMYCNDLAPYENMISFVMSKRFGTEAHWWKSDLVGEAQKLITSSSHFFYYEDEAGNLYSIRKY